MLVIGLRLPGITDCLTGRGEERPGGSQTRQ